jgi:hypothetical protein
LQRIENGELDVWSSAPYTLFEHPRDDAGAAVDQD